MNSTSSSSPSSHEDLPSLPASLPRDPLLQEEGEQEEEEEEESLETQKRGVPAPFLGQGKMKRQEKYHVEHASSLFIYLQLSFCVIGTLLHGYHSGALNQPQGVMTTCPEWDEMTSATVFPPCFRPSASLWGAVVGMYSIGGLLGSLVAGKMADRLGRRKLLAINDVFFLAGALVMALSLNEAMLILGRVLLGLGGGSSSVVVPMYLNEVSPRRVRGAVGTLNQLSFCIGVLVTQVAGFFLSTVQGWRCIFGLSVLFCVLQLGLLPFCVESPKWLAMKSENGLSYISLKRLRGVNDDSLESDFKEMTESFTDTSVSYNLRDMFKRRSLRKPLLLMAFLQVAIQASGINAVFYYSTDIFNKTNPTISSYLTVSIGVLSLLMTFVPTFLADKAGRKILLLIGAAGMALTGALYTVAFAVDVPVLAVFCSYSYVSFFSISLGSLPFILLTEVFPTQALGLASSICLPMNWIMGYMIGQVFPLMSLFLGSYVFLPFTAFLIVAFLVVLFFVPETKGKTLAEIYQAMGIEENYSHLAGSIQQL